MIESMLFEELISSNDILGANCPNQNEHSGFCIPGTIPSKLESLSGDEGLISCNPFKLQPAVTFARSRPELGCEMPTHFSTLNMVGNGFSSRNCETLD